MTKPKPKTDAQVAKDAFSSYIATMAERLKDPDCPAAVLSEARRFFEGQGISLEDGKGATPEQEVTRNRLREQLDKMKQSG